MAAEDTLVMEVQDPITIPSHAVHRPAGSQQNSNAPPRIPLNLSIPSLNSHQAWKPLTIQRAMSVKNRETSEAIAPAATVTGTVVTQDTGIAARVVTLRRQPMDQDRDQDSQREIRTASPVHPPRRREHWLSPTIVTRSQSSICPFPLPLRGGDQSSSPNRRARLSSITGTPSTIGHANLSYWQISSALVRSYRSSPLQCGQASISSK